MTVRERVDSVHDLRPPSFDEADTLRVQSETIPAEPGDDSETEPFHLKTLLRNKALVAAVAVLSLTAGFAFDRLRPTHYTATATVLVGTIPEPAEISARGEAINLAGSIVRLRTSLARIEAEIEGDPEFSIPADLAELVSDDAEGEAILQNERALFDLHQSSLENGLESLRERHSLYESEVNTLQQQIELAEQQEGSLDQEVSAVRGLVSRQLAPESRLLDLERTAAVLASRTLELQSERLKAQQLVSQTGIEIFNLQNDRLIELRGLQQQTAAALDEAEENLSTTQSLVSGLSGSRAPSEELVANAAEMIQSNAMAEAVVRRLRLFDLPEFQSWLPDVTEGELTSELRIERAAAYLLYRLEASQVGPASRIDVSFTSDEADTASVVANGVALTFLERNQPADEASPRTQRSQGHSSLLRQASAPSERDGPDTLKVLLAATIFGIALGCAAAILKEMVRQSLKPKLAY